MVRESTFARLGFGLRLLGIIGLVPSVYSLVSRGFATSYIVASLFFVGLLGLGVILMWRDPYVRSVGIWKYTPKVPFMWWVGLVLFAIGVQIGVGIALDSYRNGGVTQFGASIFAVVAFLTVVGLVLMVKVVPQGNKPQVQQQHPNGK